MTCPLWPLYLPCALILQKQHFPNRSDFSTALERRSEFFNDHLGDMTPLVEGGGVITAVVCYPHIQHVLDLMSLRHPMENQ
jgi:hypothetical protein